MFALGSDSTSASSTKLAKPTAIRYAGPSIFFPSPMVPVSE